MRHAHRSYRRTADRIAAADLILGLRIWVSLSHARTPVASVLDVVTLLAFAVVIIGIAYGLVGDRPRPPWREAQLPRASAR